MPEMTVYILRHGRSVPTVVPSGREMQMAREDNGAEYYCRAVLNGAYNMTSKIKILNVTCE